MHNHKQQVHHLIPNSADQSFPEKSHQAARKLFKKFNLSKFADGATPSNYIPTEKTPEGAHHVASVKQVREFQMKALEHHLRNISKMETPNRGFTLALSEEARKKLFPSFNVKTGTVDLKDVIDLIERNMRGTEFFNKGNPVLNRLALRARAQEILAGKGKAKK